jgi:arylsulfatase A-like enzyme
MRAASLLGVFLVAKAAVLAGREVPLSPWTPVAYLWQDLGVVLLFGVLDRWARRPRVAWAVYGAVVLYTALNVPVARVLGTPLTWPLLRAARGPLADSIVTYVTWANAGFMALVLAAAVLSPLLVRRVPARVLGLAGAVIVPPLVVMGPAAAGRVETFGLHRNVLAILVTTALPRITAEGLIGGERASPFPGGPAEDLSRFQGSAAGRNVVLILLESTAARYLRPYGAAEDPMPHLTELAGRSILFENAYAVYPESIKGLFSVLCSTYPALDTAPELYERVQPPSLAEVLAQAGYQTGLFHSGRFGYLGMESVVRNRGFQTLEDAGDIGGDRNSSFGVDDERIAVQRVLAWIDALPSGQRFFVTYLPIAGHHPYNAPEPGPCPDEEAIGRYRNALHHADLALGELLRGLRERALDQNTLLVMHGDHGEAFGQHPGNFAHTLAIYEENVRVPYLIAAPGLVNEPVRPRRLASLVDTAPTVLDLLGLPAPEAYQGRSLLAGPPRLVLFFTDYSLALLGLRDDRWKFLHELETGRSRLFDLAQDPGETRDLSAQFPERVTAYREHLRHWSAAQRNLILRPR